MKIKVKNKNFNYFNTIKSKNNHKMMRLIFRCFFLALFILGGFKAVCQNKFLIINDFDENKLPSRPNFAESNSWAALPSLVDMADQVPKSKSQIRDNQSEAKVDVFFIYPTIYTQKPENEFTWNASIADKNLNERIDNSAIKNQASVFNGSCKVYSPRYRQAHYSVFLTKDTFSARKAMEVAYEDVKEAFKYYLENYNHNRPIIIAAHSQGTLHAVRLLKEFFDDKPLKSQLVTSYLVGMPVNDSMFQDLKISLNPSDVGGYLSWNTFANGYFPEYYENGLNKAQSVNPITWTATKTFTNYADHKGTLGLKFKISPQIISSKQEEGILWIKKPKVAGKVFVKTKIWHFADYNLFWMDIRENVALRVRNYNEQHDIK
jgi:hypothetical protein